MPHREGTDALSDRVRMLLVRTLYTQPTSLAIGAANGAISSAVAAFLGGEGLLFILAAALTAVAIARVAMAFYLPAHTGSGDVRKLEIAYEVGAFAYSLVLGLVAAATMLMELPVGIELLMVANALGYGIGITTKLLDGLPQNLDGLINECRTLALDKLEGFYGRCQIKF